MASELQPGLTLFEHAVAFRVYSPRAARIEVVVQDQYRNPGSRRTFPLCNTGSGWWEARIEGDYYGHFYGYRVTSGEPPPPNQPVSEHTIPDPYARHWAVENTYLQTPLAKIERTEPFNWMGDRFLTPADPRDLVIYETHIKDLVAHPETGRKYQENGVYAAFAAQGLTGGIDYLKKLGVNAVEFLPLQHFAYFEPAYLEATTDGVLNTWNLYGRNYWGYMTSNWFLPHLGYASNGGIERGAILNNSADAIREFKTLVRELHKAGIAVIVDVVYNHLSQYDLNPLKHLDINYYLRRNRDGYFTSDSGCGNDLRSEAYETRRLIIASLKHWMTEFHVDGFRFDLAKILDWETVESIRDELRSVNPYALLIAEPWGGGYDPQGFSYRSWAAWNDQIRNGVKGSDPVFDKGFIFGSWHHNTTRFALENYLSGTLSGKDGGRFFDSRHTVNYLESHDNHTLADFIRIGLDGKKASTRFTDEAAFQTLSPTELKLSKLAALYLFSSQGITMIHAGQELGRGKRIAESPENDPSAGMIDHNSYEKDNATNWINFDLMEWNSSLYRYYLGLITLRKASPALRRSPVHALRFAHSADPLFIDLTISGGFSGDNRDYRILLNGNAHHGHMIHLDSGWIIAADADKVYESPEKMAAPVLHIPAQTGMMLVRPVKITADGLSSKA
jgi:pullulanase/glycogen debranching enzyme